MDYSNPMQMFQNVDPVPNNPFWSGMMGARNQAVAQPFIDMGQQSNALDLQKKTMETGEFMSPQAQDVRQRELGQRGAKADFETKNYQEQIRGLAPEMDARIAKAKDITMRLQGSPYQDLITDIGASYDQLHEMPPEQRAGAWAGMVQRWQMTHPGLQVPDQFRQYNEEHFRDAGAIRYNQLNSPEQVGKERIAMIGADSGLNREAMQQEGANYRARVSADAHVRAATERPQTAETPQKAIARLRKELVKNPKNAEAVDEYKSYLDDSWQKEKSNDMTLAMLQIRMMNAQDPKQQEAASSQLEEMRRKFYSDRGVYLGAPADGTIRMYQGKRYQFDGGFGKNPNDKKNWKEIK